MVNQKKKGNRWENKLANWLQDNGIKAHKDSASGGGNREKGDISNNLDMTIESKAAKTIKLMDWWKQVEGAANTHHNTPVLFIHKDGMKDDEWLVVMNNWDWLDLVQGDNKFVSDYTDPQKKWRLQRLLEAVKAVMKDYE